LRPSWKVAFALALSRMSPKLPLALMNLRKTVGGRASARARL